MARILFSLKEAIDFLYPFSSLKLIFLLIFVLIFLDLQDFIFHNFFMLMINICLNHLNIKEFPDRYPLLILYFIDVIKLTFYFAFKFLLFPHAASLTADFQGSISIFEDQKLPFRFLDFDLFFYSNLIFKDFSNFWQNFSFTAYWHHKWFIL